MASTIHPGSGPPVSPRLGAPAPASRGTDAPALDPRDQSDVAGTPVAWHEAGEGFPVVFVHGIPTGPALWRHVIPLIEGARCYALARQVRSLNVNDTLSIADRLGLLDVPARILWGADDQFQKIRYGRRLAVDLDAELISIPGGKHFVPEDHPGDIAAAVGKVLAEV